jgi:hypothetical protein
MKRPSLSALSSVSRWLALLGLLVVASGCGIPQVLSPALPDSAGTVSVGKSLSQPFLAPSDGLDGITVAASPPLSAEGDLPPHPTGGATVSIRYAPEADTRFPEEAFHDWPASDQWLGELTGDDAFGQSFLSRYPGLNGITLRVATFGADTGAGEGTIEAGPSVDVLAFPADGAVVATLAGGATVNVIGSAEGYAEISLEKERIGYVPLTAFSELPSPARKNTHDVVLTLYRESDMSIVRRSTINAEKLADNSHVLFAFEPIADSDGQRYRFVLTSAGSTPGNAVTFRYQPETSYADGQRFDGSTVAGGALIFRPDFAPAAPLYQANLDTLEWSSLTNAFVGGFAAKANTADRFLSVDLAPGDRTLNVCWSLARPVGGAPMVVDGNAQTPGGGLVFDARFRGELSLRAIASSSLHDIGRDISHDPAFFTIYLVAILALVGWSGWAGVRKVQRGR